MDTRSRWMASLVNGFGVLSVPYAVLTAAPAMAVEVDPVALEEVIVSAQRREQDAQDVPVSLLAFSGEDLRELNVASVSDLARFTPNLMIRNTVGNSMPTVTIRGIGNISGDINSAGSSPSAAFHVDEVYLGSPAFLGFQLFDVQRVEVLKGPQGTLFGRNTTAGTVNVYSNRPSGTPGGELEVGYDNFQAFTGSGYVTGPLSDSVNYRLAGSYAKGDTYYRRPNGNRLDGPDKFALRALFDATAGDADLLLNLHGGRDRSGVIRPHLIGYRGEGCDFLQTGKQDPSRCVNGVGGPTYEDRYRVDGSREDTFRFDGFGGSLRAEVPVGGLDLVSITAWERLNAFIPEEGDSDPAVGFFEYDERSRVRQYSQELRISDQPDWGGWTVGLYAIREQARSINRNYLFGGPLSDAGTDLDTDRETTAYSLFGQTEISLSEPATLVLGLRGTEDRQELDVSSSLGEFFGGAILGIPQEDPIWDPATRRYVTLPPTEESKSESNLSGTLGLNYALDVDTLAYISVRSGYRSGQFPTGSVIAVRNPTRPEELYAYEIGIKTQSDDGRFRFNASLFHYDYRDLQVSSIVVLDNQPVGSLTNADKARVRGFDLDANWNATEAVSLSAAIGYADAEFTRFDALQPGGVERIDRSGQPLPNAPELTATLGIRVDVPLGDGTLSTSINGTYRSKVLFSYLTDRPLDRWFRDPSATKLNARIAWIAPGDRLEVAAFIDNVGDEETAYQMFDGVDAAVEYLDPPRRYGGTVTVRF